MVHGEKGGELCVRHQAVRQGERPGLSCQQVIVIHAGLVA